MLCNDSHLLQAGKQDRDGVVSVVPSWSCGSVSKYQVIIQAGAGAEKPSQYAPSASLKGSSAKEINVLLTQRPSLFFFLPLP